MKRILTAALLLTAIWAQATLTQTQSFSGGTIADGNPLGTVFSGTYSQTGFNSPVLGATVGLEITGGYNGDLYAYLVAPNGTLVMLMNQPGVGVNGFGASGAGMNITLADSGSTGIQGVTSGSVLSGTYSAAGTLGTFNNSTANGTWQLFFADLGAGGGTSTLNGWTLTLTVVPEPITWALGIFLAVFLALAGLRRDWQT